MSTATHPAIDRVVDTYIAIWNETDPNRRGAMIAEAYTEDATYLDPMLRADGPATIDAMIAAVQAQFPGHAFRRTGPIDAPHAYARFPWALVDTATDVPLIAGLDVAHVAPDGRLRSIVGFHDLVPELPVDGSE